MEDIALFEAAYPGVNWRKLSFAPFYERIRLARRIYAELRSVDPTDAQHERMVDGDNQRIYIRRRFRFMFPND